MRKLNSEANFQNISYDQLDDYNLKNDEKEFLGATIQNRDILFRAKKELDKPNLDQELFGNLLLDHHSVLRDNLEVSTPKIELMLNSAMEAGAFGGKISGSGGGGCMFAYCPNNPEEVRDAINNVGGRAHIVYADDGTTINTK